MPDDVYKNKLTDHEYHILREGGTEIPFTGKSILPGEDGRYHCRACDAALFAHDAKFESGTGWPSFDQALPGAVRELTDISYGMTRIEVRCATCDSHLGHVFEDGPTKTGRRYCTNSVCFG
jgi:peptide-methionine (R)-S-oxide reductase